MCLSYREISRDPNPELETPRNDTVNVNWSATGLKCGRAGGRAGKGGVCQFLSRERIDGEISRGPSGTHGLTSKFKAGPVLTPARVKEAETRRFSEARPEYFSGLTGPGKQTLGDPRNRRIGYTPQGTTSTTLPRWQRKIIGERGHMCPPTGLRPGSFRESIEFANRTPKETKTN
ncbi:hypothetical protein BDM02DRAFT_2830695 [Thelephora ganbajun]|uniref:Uncharacterized protein n=1 Tax=Thelephora ganbajun TaxID=370292 RepID=A0ACB6ZBM2_THEGA|nr:hypothetical protein BDM02DRAFT_2830695 [Thelephora ganbajun]